MTILKLIFPIGNDFHPQFDKNKRCATMKRPAVALLVLLTIVVWPYGTYCQSIGTPETREALFDTIVNRTLRWEAWSPFKERKNSEAYAEDAEILRTEFIEASSEFDLVLVLQKLSNLRQDRHLFVDENFPRVRDIESQAPIRFWPDFSDEQIEIFAIDTATNFSDFSNVKATLGDHVVAINHIPLSDYYKMLIPFLRFSTVKQAKWEFAKAISKKESLFDPLLYRKDESIQYTMERENGSRYLVSVPYHAENHIFSGHGMRVLNGYQLLAGTIDVDMYVKYLEDNIIVLLHWKDFEEVSSSVNRVIQKAMEYNLLDANVILDISESSGGSGAPELIRILTQRSFQTTFGNVKIGDYLDDFKQDFSGRVRDWLDNDVEASRAKGEEYSANVPFKLRYFSKDQNGIMEPATVRFKGKVVMISGSNTGSQVDQCAAMMIDNDIPVASIGMPCGGYSNTWEYEPAFNFPEGSDNWFEYQWNIGHTIRPNGEVLEANPALPRYPYLLTNENFASYFDDMIQAAEDTLRAYKVNVTCTLSTPKIQIEEGRLVTDFNPTYKYNWFKNDNLLEAETGRILNQIPSFGEYRVEVIQGLCKASSAPFIWNITAIAESRNGYLVYPNPLQGSEITLESSGSNYDLSFRLIEITGKEHIIMSERRLSDRKYVIKVDDALSGIFVLKVYASGHEIYEGRLLIKKLTK